VLTFFAAAGAHMKAMKEKGFGAQASFRDAVRNFAQDVIRPRSAVFEEAKSYPGCVFPAGLGQGAGSPGGAGCRPAAFR